MVISEIDFPHKVLHKLLPSFNLAHCEDTITLTVTWENFPKADQYLSVTSETVPNKVHMQHQVYTSSWVQGNSDVHSQQRFFCLMEKGEVNADQQHRGYTIQHDETGKFGNGNTFQSVNPFYIRNTPDSKGRYCGQQGYGYVSFERFVEQQTEINNEISKPEDFDDDLPTGRSTLLVTQILEAGRIWGKNSTKTHQNRKFKLYHVFITFLLKDFSGRALLMLRDIRKYDFLQTFYNFLQLSGLVEFLPQ